MAKVGREGEKSSELWRKGWVGKSKRSEPWAIWGRKRGGRGMVGMQVLLPHTHCMNERKWFEENVYSLSLSLSLSLLVHILMIISCTSFFLF